MSVGAAVERLSTLVAFEIPGKSRILTKEEIAAEYGERATRPIPAAYHSGRKTIRSRINMDSIAPFYVCRVHTTGKRTFMSSHRTWSEAEDAAGKLRDLMTDAECALDYSYEAFERKRGKK